MIGWAGMVGREKKGEGGSEREEEAMDKEEEEGGSKESLTGRGNKDRSIQKKIIN